MQMRCNFAALPHLCSNTVVRAGWKVPKNDSDALEKLATHPRQTPRGIQIHDIEGIGLIGWQQQPNSTSLEKGMPISEKGTRIIGKGK